MGLFNRVFGGGSSGGKPKESEASPEVTSSVISAQPSTLASQEPATSTGPSLASTSAGINPELLRDLSPNSSLLKAARLELDVSSQQTTRLYNPYDGLSAAVGAKPHAFKLPTGPEFVFEEEAAVRRRGWTENLQFYTGLGYLSGGSVGVSAGMYHYMTTSGEIPLTTLKLKANRFLNTAGSYARPFSNGAGIMGLFFSSAESLLLHNMEPAGIPDSACTTLAGMTAGALFRAPRGPRQAAAAGVLGAAFGATVVGLRKMFPSL